jgi:PAS domain S-box-containing protein
VQHAGGQTPSACCPEHTLRRTLASALVASGNDPRSGTTYYGLNRGLRRCFGICRPEGSHDGAKHRHRSLGGYLRRNLRQWHWHNRFELGAPSTTLASANAREQERVRSNAIAELDRAKTAFFTNVSHEFRTPLAVILGVVDDMLGKTDQALRDSSREELSVIRRNGLRLLKLVNTVLAFSKVEAGRIRAVYGPTDLAAFTTELASGFRSTMEKAGLTFRVESEALPEPVYVDPDMWEKIVLNLLSNAFKFTLQGEVSLTLKCVENAAQLLVKDTGIGIQEDEVPRIFERFHRVEGAQGRTQEGTGIGLALVQELVALHGGTIRAESVLGKGTTFIVSIPLGMKHLPADRILADPAPISPGLAASVYAEEAGRWLSGTKEDGKFPEAEISPTSHGGDRPFVLVADDNSDMRDYFRSLLQGRYTVQTVADGEQALAAVRARKPDLVLSDVMMPTLDGFSLLRRLRAGPETQAIPVIMISARAGEDEKIEGMEQGADDYLVKPFGFRELLARVRSHLELARMRRETTERERKLRAEADSQRALLETVLNEMPAGVVIAQAPSGSVVLANRQAEEILQRPVMSLRRIEDYAPYQLFRLDGQQYDTEDQPLARSLRGEVVFGEELRYLRPDGTFRVLLTNSAPVRDEAGTIVAGAVAFQDITDLRMAQEELLRRSNDVIQELAGKLISAQEEERKRIARDLHDDFAQRLALRHAMELHHERRCRGHAHCG